MKKSQFFSIYILIHGLVLALVIGMGAAAFSMSPEGLLILEAPTTATTSANTRGAMVSKIEAEKDKVKKGLKPIIGGCEVWTSGGYFRIKRWGQATSSDPNSPECLCPTGSIKTGLSTSTKPINRLGIVSDEWRLKYNVTIDMFYNGSTSYYIPVCTDKTNPNETGGALGVFANSLISDNYTSTTSQLIFYFNQYPWPMQAYEQGFGYCYMNGINFSSSVGMDPTTCCCEIGACSAQEYNQSIPYCSQAEAIANLFGIPWDGIQTGPNAFTKPSGCGLVVFNHNPTSSPNISLPSGTTAMLEKFICTATTNGWDNNWGLP